MYVSIRLKAELIADKSALIIIINTLVFSKLFYCSSVVATPSDESNLDKLQAVQNFACRFGSGAGKFDHNTPLLLACAGSQLSNKLGYFQLAVFSI